MSDSTIKWVQHWSIKGPATCHEMSWAVHPVGPAAWLFAKERLGVCVCVCVCVCARMCDFVFVRRILSSNQMEFQPFAIRNNFNGPRRNEWRRRRVKKRRRERMKKSLLRFKRQVQNKAAGLNATNAPCAACMELKQLMGIFSGAVLNLLWQ